MAADLRKHVRTPLLDVAYEESGAGGWRAGLSDAWLALRSALLRRSRAAARRSRLSRDCALSARLWRDALSFADTPRSGQQAALGNDLCELMDALAIERAVLAGYDWGGRAACIVAALWPRARARPRHRQRLQYPKHSGVGEAGSRPSKSIVSGTNIIFTPNAARAGLETNRRAFCRLLWELWSPLWAFDDATFERSAVSFDNPDFVAMTIQSYRHRFGYAPGDPALEPIEAGLPRSRRSPCRRSSCKATPTACSRPDAFEKLDANFTGPYQRRRLPKIGHNPPQEAPRAFADAILERIAQAGSFPLTNAAKAAICTIGLNPHLPSVA